MRFYIQRAYLIVWFTAVCSPGMADVINFDAENGQTPESLGYFIANGATSGHHANAGFNIPELGSNVWEVTVNGFSGGYVNDLTGVASLDDGFVFSTFFRGLTTVPQGGAIGNIGRNRPMNTSYSAQPSNGLLLQEGQWYFLEMRKNIGEELFERALYTVSHSGGAKTLLDLDTGVSPIFQPSSGGDAFPNSIGFSMENVGSTLIRTQFDNVRFETMSVPEPSSLVLLSVLLGCFIIRRRYKSRTAKLG